MHFAPYNWRLEADKALVQEAETVAGADKALEAVKQPPSAAK
jgi:hypothetical protein